MTAARVPAPGTRLGVVIPTVGRPSLGQLLDSLDATLTSAGLAADVPLLVVDDRRPPRSGRPPGLVLSSSALDVRVVRSGGRGPAAARNAGWRSLPRDVGWVAFLDDDVLLPATWATDLANDLAATGPRTGGVQGRLHVPLPPDRRPTDWERGTAGLERAAWATADMAYRRDALVEVGGFDERFPRAFREDADLALRVREAGWSLDRGARTTTHPVRPARDDVSLRVQAGARDDARMRALHGRRWRERAATGRGRFRWHVVTVASAGAVLLELARRRPRGALLAGAGWAALTLTFLGRRVLPGPRPREDGFGAELRRMAWTSVAIPFAAVAHRVAGGLAVRRHPPVSWPPPLRAVLFDRDDTLVRDVPYNGDPDAVEPLPGALSVLEGLRDRGIRTGLVSNQSGIARGAVSRAEVDAVNARVASLLGPFDTVQVCPHGPDDACGCRKPEPGLVLAAATELGVAPAECAVVGDIGADVEAALAAGATPVLVPTPRTRPEEVASAPATAPDLAGALALLDDRLAGRTDGASR